MSNTAPMKEHNNFSREVFFFSILKSFIQFEGALVGKGEGRDGAKAKPEIQGWGKSRVRNRGKRGQGGGVGFFPIEETLFNSKKHHRKSGV